MESGPTNVARSLKSPRAARSRLASGTVVPLRLIWGRPRNKIYLEVYGTGVRAANSVTATVGGPNVPVLYAGPAPGYAGRGSGKHRPDTAVAGRRRKRQYLTYGGRTGSQQGECDYSVTICSSSKMVRVL